MERKHKRNYFLILICLSFLTIGIYTNIKTVSYAEKRVVEEINSTPILLDKNNIEETIIEDEIVEEEIVEESEILGTVTEAAPEPATNSFVTIELVIIIISSLITVISLLTIIITNIGSLRFKEAFGTSKRLIYYTMFLIILGTSLPIATIIINDKQVLNNGNIKKRDEKSIAVVEITKDEKKSSLKEETKENDTSVIQVSKNANFIAEKLEIYKNGGITSDIDSTLYYGLNSALIIKDGSNGEISESTIKTNSNYSPGIYVTGTGSEAMLNNINLTTEKNNSNAITSSDISSVTGESLNINTTGNSSSAIKTMNEDSGITINSSIIKTTGTLSPLFYSNGKIEINNVEGTSLKSYIGIVEGKNSLSITESELITNTGTIDSNENLRGAFLLYNNLSQSMSANVGNTSFTIELSEIRIDKESKHYETAPLFIITNTTSIINITDTKLRYGSDILLKAIKNNTYGDIGNNGADVNLTATDQYLTGKIIVDELSKVRLHLNNSTYKGGINVDNLSKDVDITFDKQSKWILTDDSYINTLTIQNGKISRLRTSISSNGHNIYYNAHNNEWLNGRTITLTGGGKLIPIYES